MKLFQKLLVAPAALGLMAPMAVNAAEINLNGISDYAPATTEFQSASELSDIHPSDWTFQALTEIRNNRGCNVSLPQGVITRVEAAALLNKCLSETSQLNQAELRLVDEFAPELAAIKGNQDVVDSFSFEAGQFSTTTTMAGYSNMLIGSVDGQANENLTAFYGYGIDLLTSFDGEDLLTAGIAQGNFDDSASELSSMDMSDTSNSLTVGSLFYSFPVNGFDVTAGPLLDQDDVVSVTTSLYSDAFKLGANPSSLPGSTGTGAAISKATDSGFNFAASFIATEASGAAGIGTEEGEDVLTAMIGYDGEGFGGGLIFTTLANGDAGTTGYDAFGGGIYYKGDSYTLSATYDTKDSEGVADTQIDWLIGSDIDLGPGTLSIALSNVPDTDANDHDETSYEVYYTYPLSDYITITPGWFFINGDTGAEDLNGIAVNTNFTF